MKKIVCLSSVLLLAAGANTSLTAGRTIGIDFGVTAPVAGSNFNQYSNVIIAAGATDYFSGMLIDTTGANVTGVGFSVQNNAASKATTKNVNPGLEGAGLMTDASIYADAILIGRDNATSDDHLTLTFTGLGDSSTYNLVGGFDQNIATHNAVWAVGGQSVTTDPTTTGGGFAGFTGLSTDGSGNLVITVTESTRYVAVAGVTLEAIPPKGAVLMIR